jgi:hypothetical protein
MFYDDADGTINSDGSFIHFGGVEKSDIGGQSSAHIDLHFRMATNGVIVNTLINGEPLITTSAGLFDR